MLIEDEFSVRRGNWQKRLVDGSYWEDVEKICDAAVQEEDLGFEETLVNEAEEEVENKVLGEQVLDAIYDDAYETMMWLYGSDDEVRGNLKNWFGETESVNGYGSSMQVAPKDPAFWQKAWTVS